MTTAAEFKAKVDKSVTNMDRLDQFVNGASGSTVATDNGLVPAIATVVQQATIDAATVSAAAAVAQAMANYRATRAEGVTDFSVGQYFSSAETGEVRVYKRISSSPFYQDQGDAAAPISKALLQASGAALLIGLTLPSSVTSSITTLQGLLNALTDGELDFAPATGGTDDGVKSVQDATHARSFFGGIETAGPEDDEAGYWNYWINQLGRSPVVGDQGIYARGGARFCLAPGDYAGSLYGHNSIGLGVASNAHGVGNAAGSAVACEFAGVISGSTLTVVEIRYGALANGRALFGLKADGSSFISSGVTVLTQSTGSTGYEGTYTISSTATIGAVANITASNPVITITSGALQVGQRVIVPGLLRPTTVIALGSGTATLAATPAKSSTGATISVIMAVGNYANARTDFIGYGAVVPGGKNCQAVGQQSEASGEQCEALVRAGVAEGRLAVARGHTGNTASGNEVETSKSRDYWSGVWGEYITSSGAGTVTVGTGPNAGSPLDNPFDRSIGAGMNVQVPTFHVMEPDGSNPDGYVLTRGGIELWTKVNTTWVRGARITTTTVNGGGGGYDEFRVKVRQAGADTDVIVIDPVTLAPQFFGDRMLMGTARTIPTATSAGVAGERCWDADYIYQCVATNTWKRTPITTW